MKKPLVLCIMDGYGIKDVYGNAIAAASKPNLDKFFAENAYTTIGASGMAVGLPDGQMGNSEVGHTNMGAGRIVYQELTRITKSIKDGNFFDNEALKGAMENCKANGSALHLMGLMSDGGVHSHITHLYAIVEMAKKYGLSEVYVHCFLDGRDVPPASGADYVAQLRDKLAEIGVGRIATVMGRYYAMDRDNRWERVAKAYAAIVYGEGVKNADPVAAIKASYEQIDEEGKNITDEFVIPVVCTEGAGMKANDSVIFFNFRPDRAREITRTLVDPEFKGFERRNGMFPLYYVCMTQYDATMPNVHIAFKPQMLPLYHRFLPPGRARSPSAPHALAAAAAKQKSLLVIFICLLSFPCLCPQQMAAATVSTPQGPGASFRARRLWNARRSRPAQVALPC